MAELKPHIRADLTAAMKARDAERAGTLRMVLAAIMNAEVAGSQARELSDDDVIGVLTSEAKKRRESAEAFAAAGRSEMADKERREGEIIAEYLPAPLSADELEQLVTDVVGAAGAAGQGMSAMGKVMAIVQPQVKGKADGAVVAAEVKRQLGASGG